MRVFYEVLGPRHWHTAEPVDWLDAGPGVERRVCVTMSPDEWEALQRAANEQVIYTWLVNNYVQESNERQRAMGLHYTTAETHELARNLAKYLKGMIGR